jgi:hypothetical protein
MALLGSIKGAATDLSQNAVSTLAWQAVSFVVAEAHGLTGVPDDSPGRRKSAGRHCPNRAKWSRARIIAGLSALSRFESELA